MMAPHLSLLCFAIVLNLVIASEPTKDTEQARWTEVKDDGTAHKVDPAVPLPADDYIGTKETGSGFGEAFGEDSKEILFDENVSYEGISDDAYGPELLRNDDEEDTPYIPEASERIHSSEKSPYLKFLEEKESEYDSQLILEGGNLAYETLRKKSPSYESKEDHYDESTTSHNPYEYPNGAEKQSKPKTLKKPFHTSRKPNGNRRHSGQKNPDHSASTYHGNDENQNGYHGNSDDDRQPVYDSYRKDTYEGGLKKRGYQDKRDDDQQPGYDSYKKDSYGGFEKQSSYHGNRDDDHQPEYGSNRQDSYGDFEKQASYQGSSRDDDQQPEYGSYENHGYADDGSQNTYHGNKEGNQQQSYGYAQHHSNKQHETEQPLYHTSIDGNSGYGYARPNDNEEYNAYGQTSGHSKKTFAYKEQSQKQQGGSHGASSGSNEQQQHRYYSNNEDGYPQRHHANQEDAYRRPQNHQSDFPNRNVKHGHQKKKIPYVQEQTSYEMLTKRVPYESTGEDKYQSGHGFQGNNDRYEAQVYGQYNVNSNKKLVVKDEYEPEQVHQRTNQYQFGRQQEHKRNNFHQGNSDHQGYRQQQNQQFNQRHQIPTRFEPQKEKLETHFPKTNLEKFYNNEAVSFPTAIPRHKQESHEQSFHQTGFQKNAPPHKSSHLLYGQTYDDILSYCSGFPDGTLIGDTRKNCQTYFTCKHGHAIQLVCPKGKNMDVRFGACTNSPHMKCSNKPILPALRQEASLSTLSPPQQFHQSAHQQASYYRY